MNNQTLFVFKKQQQEYNMVRQLKKVTKQLKKLLSFMQIKLK